MMAAWAIRYHDEMEKDWLWDYNAQHLSGDKLSFAFGFIVNFFNFAKVPLSDMNGGALFTILGTLHQIVILVLIFGCQKFFIRWRGTILITHLVVKGFEFQVMAVNTAEYRLIHPLEMPQSNNFKVAMHVGVTTLALMYSTCTLMMTTRRFQVLSGYGILTFMYSSFERCRQEVEGVPGQGQRYMAMATTVESFISQAFIPPTSYPSRLPVGAAVLSEIGSCVALHSSCLITFVYFLPMGVMIAEELVSRKAFSKRRRISSPAIHPAKVIIFQHLLLLPFQGAISFQFLVFLLRLGGW